ncbi:MAG: CreA family protein [Azospirillaceae bacterium]|nr:CreA family protein [Azospirillaceae bacterium]
MFKRPHAAATTAAGLAGILALMTALVTGARAEEIGCVTTAWKLIGANHRICVEAFDDPKVPGVACHLSQARAGGVAGSLGLAEDPSRFSIACRQIGPITVPTTLTANEEVFTSDTSILFKETHVIRMIDRKRNTLVYLSYSRKLIDGSPMNAISTVPVMPWNH